MYKSLNILICNLLICNLLIFNLFAEPVDSVLAKKVALNFITNKSQVSNLKSQISINLVYTAYNSNNSQIQLYFIFNINPDGFVIIAADNNVSPVLAYSLHGKYSIGEKPPAFIDWMKNYEDQLIFIKENNLKADANIQSLWNSFSQNSKLIKNARGGAGVSPLLKTTWDQGCYYNNYCPASNGPCNHDLTGCTATAMSQIMKYWNYPPKGMGVHTDSASVQPSHLTLDFSKLNFRWDTMPNSPGSSSTPFQINALDSLMYACGVSIDMQYSAGSSGAWLSAVPFALENYFNYSTSAVFIFQYNYLAQHTMQDWINMLENELNNGRPVQYQGYNSAESEGHSFVCDGYDNTDYFHFNWGWSGGDDGYFLINQLTPGGWNWSYYQGAIIGIKPAPVPGINLELYSNIALAPDTINNTKPFSVNVSILNPDSVNFTGRIAAFLFDVNNKRFLVDSTLNIQQINKSAYHQFIFSSNGIDSAVPGIYKLGILYHTLSGEWVLAANGNYDNLVDVVVTGPLYKLKLNSDINVSPSPILQYDSVNITCLVNNYGNGIFKGKLGLGLLNAGKSWLEYLDSIDNVIIPPDTTISFTFRTKLSQQPGNYYLEAWFQQWDSVEVYLPNGKYSNPKAITILYKPDIYEPDSSEANAYSLNIYFRGDGAKILTNGSNFNSCQDTDYYRILLPVDYDYTVSAYLEDKGNNKSFNTLADFTCKPISTDSNPDSAKWSLIYTDIDTSSSKLLNGGVIYFKAFPKAPCSPGTYMLNITVKRTANSSSINNILNPQSSILNIFPNPASDILYVQLPSFNIQHSTLTIYNSLGNTISQFSILNSQFSIKTTDYPNGIYFLEAIINDKVYSKKFIISR